MPVKPIRGVGQIVGRNTSIDLVNWNVARAKKHYQICHGVTGWDIELFRVNRFYVQRSKESVVTDDRWVKNSLFG